MKTEKMRFESGARRYTLFKVSPRPQSSFFIHFRHKGIRVKRSLQTPDPATAVEQAKRAIQEWSERIDKQAELVLANRLAHRGWVRHGRLEAMRKELRLLRLRARLLARRIRLSERMQGIEHQGAL